MTAFVFTRSGPPLDAPPWPTLAALFAADPATLDRPALIGPTATFTRADVLAMARRAAALKLPEGLVAVLCPPGADEAPLAVAALALLAAGVSVALPADRAALGDLPIVATVGDALPGLPPLGLRTGPEAPLTARAPTLWLTTSGSTGAPKWVPYPEAALLAGVHAWQTAGLLAPDRLGGPSLCPLLAHSMGFRNALHAVVCGAPTLFLPPEWLTTRPIDAAELLAHPPSHVTAGPALFHRFARLIEALPALAPVARGLRVMVSTGAAVDPRLADLFPRARLANAFGTTETQQVLTTLLDDGPPHTLGAPLPGVTVGLTADGALHVRAPFAHCADWWSTGDRLRLDGDALVFAGRLDETFLDSGHGVKMARAALEADYADLPVRALLFCAHAEAPDALALAFIGDADPAPIAEAFAARAEALAQNPLAARLGAVALVPGEPPLRGPGKIDRAAALAAHQDRLDRLAAGFDSPPFGLLLDPDRPASDFHHPVLAPLQAALGLDRVYVRGEGDTLFTDDGAPVLDLVGGFGANLLGHAHPALLAAAHAALDAVPLLDQGARRPAADELCRELALRVGRHTGRRYVVCLASTGAEAVELALRHAALERRARLDRHHAALRAAWAATRPDAVRAIIAANEAAFAAHRPLLIALDGGFHGRTAGALLGLGNASARAPFAALLGPRTVHLADGDEAALAAALVDASVPFRDLNPSGVETETPTPDLLAVLAEPIRAEGGVRPVPADWLARLARLDAPLIIDEIQTGLGRTGAFLASPVPGDMLLLGKALGGGVAKIAACLIDRARYRPEFAAHRSSTFSGDAFSAKVALAALPLLDKADPNARLGPALKRARAAAPGGLGELRGQGALFGVDLRAPAGRSITLDALVARGLGYPAAGWLLHRHAVRALPTVSAPATLRVEPSAAFADAERVEAAFTALGRVLEAGDVVELLAPLLGEVDPTAPAGRFQIARDQPAPGAARAAFIHPLLAPEALLIADHPRFAGVAPVRRQALITFLEALLDHGPIPTFSRNLFGGRVWLRGIALAATPATMARHHRAGAVETLRRQVQAAVDRAAAEGCTVIALGGHASVVTAAGTSVLPPPGAHITTGNALTAATVLHRLSPRLGRVGLLGPGNLGLALARALAPRADSLLVVGRADPPPGLSALGATYHRDPRALADCDVIVTASNASAPVLRAEHFDIDQKVMIYDMALPPAVDPALPRARPNIRLRRAGAVRLPQDLDFSPAPVLRPGRCFACAAEAALLALAPYDGSLVGPLHAEAIAALDQRARRFGLFRD